MVCFPLGTSRLTRLPNGPGLRRLRYLVVNHRATPPTHRWKGREAQERHKWLFSKDYAWRRNDARLVLYSTAKGKEREAVWQRRLHPIHLGATLSTANETIPNRLHPASYFLNENVGAQFGGLWVNFSNRLISRSAHKRSTEYHFYDGTPNIFVCVWAYFHSLHYPVE